MVSAGYQSLDGRQVDPSFSRFGHLCVRLRLGLPDNEPRALLDSSGELQALFLRIPELNCFQINAIKNLDELFETLSKGKTYLQCEM